jgi:hypothetical protein
LEAETQSYALRQPAEGVSGSLGAIGGQVGTVELVLNYNTGQVSVVVSGGVQVGWNGGAQASAFTGFIYGALGGDNSGYSGGFTTGQASAFGVGIFRGYSSGGLTGGASGLLPNGQVTATGVSLGANLMQTPTLGVSATDYSSTLSLGSAWAFTPLDIALSAASQVCQ